MGRMMYSNLQFKDIKSGTIKVVCPLKYRNVIKLHDDEQLEQFFRTVNYISRVKILLS